MQQDSLFSNEERQKELDEQIQELQKIVDYEIREYPVEVIFKKFTEKLEEYDEAELFIPDYQREFIWKKNQQSRFIESIFLNLPIPYIFAADIGQGDMAGRLEIVDGSQRVRTIVAFMKDELRLSGLKKLTKANGFVFSELSAPRQLRFKRKTLRMIELTENTDEESRREIFDRLNSGGTRIQPMEQRRGSQDGLFLQVLEQCAAIEKFKQICPVGPTREKLKEPQELALRYFAYVDRYENFNKRVDEFLNDFLDSKNKELERNPHDAASHIQEFSRMLDFVEAHFPNGFKKNSNFKSVPRIRFECIAVGTTLALKINPDLVPENIADWLNSKTFQLHTRSDASNSRPKVINRINFVRDNLLGRPVEQVEGGITIDLEDEDE